jgi:hypothetical protein
MSITPALGKVKKEYCEFKASLGSRETIAPKNQIKQKR